MLARRQAAGARIGRAAAAKASRDRRLGHGGGSCVFSTHASSSPAKAFADLILGYRRLAVKQDNIAPPSRPSTCAQVGV
jgi:hypothetical protein